MQRLTAPRLPPGAALGWEQAFASLDSLRRAQGEAIAALGFEPTECCYSIQASGPAWRVRDYGPSDAGLSVLIVATPIKRPYLWDLAPSVSAIRYCLRHGLHVYLLEWLPPPRQDGPAGLAEYADQAIGAAVARISEGTDGTGPCLMGHSLGGTLAAVFAALHPESISGLVLPGAPLCFQKG